MQGEWRYSGLTQERLAMYYCSNCLKMFVQQNPNRQPPTEKHCPNCGAEMTVGDDVYPHNCYTCRYGKDCEIAESMNEDSRREDSICDVWSRRRRVSHEPPETHI